MIELYGFFSPNVLKVAIMLEEAELAYTGRPLGVMQGANFAPEFLRLNPLGKVPVIVDHHGAGPAQPLFESGAILVYLAETYAPQFFPQAAPARWEVLKWLMMQVALVGPMLGQLNHFQGVAGVGDSYAACRYRDQSARAYRNLDDRLSCSPWLGGGDYSIADMAVHPWVGYFERHGFDKAAYPALIAWRDRIDARDTVKRAVTMLRTMDERDAAGAKPPTAEQIDRYFARSQPGPPLDLDSYVALGPTTSVRP